jgi:hypothetical protein
VPDRGTSRGVPLLGSEGMDSYRARSGECVSRQHGRCVFLVRRVGRPGLSVLTKSVRRGKLAVDSRTGLLLHDRVWRQFAASQIARCPTGGPPAPPRRCGDEECASCPLVLQCKRTVHLRRSQRADGFYSGPSVSASLPRARDDGARVRPRAAGRDDALVAGVKGRLLPSLRPSSPSPPRRSLAVRSGRTLGACRTARTAFSCLVIILNCGCPC